MKAVFADNIFRGYDIRAKIPDELNQAGAYTIGKAYAVFLSRRRINHCVVVHDNRISSKMIKQTFVKGLLESGINVTDYGLGLVYFMYFGQYVKRSKGGAMITASHNPRDYNGFKLAVGFSDTMITEEIQELREIAKSGKFLKAKRPGRLETGSILADYTKDLLDKIPQRFNFKIVVDGGNCTPGKFLPDILRKFGCKIIEQNTQLDSNFPLGAPDPTEHDYLERLADGVKKHQADLGFCYDADGDRIGIVDDQGSLIWNDTLVALFAQDILDFQPGAKIIFNTLCSKQVSDVIKKRKGQPVIWLTGHSFIKAKIKEERALFGGELSGHFFFMDNFYGHDDGAYTSLRLLAYLSRVKKSLRQAVAELPQYISSPEIKIGCPDKIKFKFVKQTLGAELKRLYPQAEFLEIDGVRLDTANEMAIIRPSQNGPYLTVKFEAKTDKMYQRLKKQLAEILHKYQQVDFSYGVNVDALE